MGWLEPDSYLCSLQIYTAKIYSLHPLHATFWSRFWDWVCYPLGSIQEALSRIFSRMSDLHTLFILFPILKG